MPRNAVRITAGVTTNETPALNEAGIASCNLIRLKYDPQGLVLVEKLGGWAKFSATQVTSIIRTLQAWQDINNNKWLGYGSTGTGTSLVALECVTNSSGITTALTSATVGGNITPYYMSISSPISFSTIAGSPYVEIYDANTTGITQFDTVNITTPISVGGIIIFGMYPITSIVGGGTYYIEAHDVLQNPLNAVYSTLAPATITGITASGSNMTVSFTASPSYTFIAGEYVILRNILPLVLNGTYEVISATANAVTVAQPTGYSAYTSGGQAYNTGMAPQVTSTNASGIMTVFFPDHGYSAGGTFAILNGTTIGGVYLFGEYTVYSVTNSYTFSFYASTLATLTETNFINAQSVINGSLSGTSVTLTIDTSPYGPTPPANILSGGEIIVSGVTPSNWNGSFNVLSSTATTITYTNASATGTWQLGGSVSNLGGMVAFIYNTTQGTAPLLGSPYGQGTYNYGVYSGSIVAPPSNLGVKITATNWHLDNWGQILLSLPVKFPALNYSAGPLYQQAIYYWDPTENLLQASVLAGSPPTSNGFFVAMPQRQIVAWGSSFNGVVDPLLLRWCDVNNFNVWVATTTNQAGSFRLSSGSMIVGGLQGPQQSFIWTDISLWTMQYSGPPYTYNINRVADGCGLIGRHAMASQNGVVYWMGKEQFYSISGEGISPIPCPVWDVIFQQLDLKNLDKITAASNSLFNEISWYYPVVSGEGEVSNYVKYNTLLGQWDYGSIGRSAWIDQSVLGTPIGYDPVNQYIYQHEISPDADGNALLSTFTTGFFALEDGNHKTFIDEWWADMKYGYYDQVQNATVVLNFITADFPEGATNSYGQFTLSSSTTYFSPRFRARLVSLQFSSYDIGSWWRVGLNRYRFQSDGKY